GEGGYEGGGGGDQVHADPDANPDPDADDDGPTPPPPSSPSPPPPPSPSLPPPGASPEEDGEEEGKGEDEELEWTTSVRTVRAGNLSRPPAPPASPPREARTPRNGNLTKKGRTAGASEARSSIPEEERCGGGRLDRSKGARDRAERRPWEERFAREVVDAALLVVVEEEEGELREGGWERAEGGGGGSSSPLLPLLRRGGGEELAGVRLVYRRRGRRRTSGDGDDNDQGKCDDDDDDDDDRYHVPAVADVSLRYALLRPSTVPALRALVENVEAAGEERPSPASAAPPSARGSAAASSRSLAALGARGIASLARRAGRRGQEGGVVAGIVEAAVAASSRGSPAGNLGGGDVGRAERGGGKGAPGGDAAAPRGRSFEADADDGGRSFEDAHGDVKLWKSFDPHRSEEFSSPSEMDSMCREHFFPEDAPQCSDGARRRTTRRSVVEGGVEEGRRADGIVVAALRDVLPLPEGYDEWIVPASCDALRLPTAELARRRAAEREEGRRRRLAERRQPPSQPQTGFDLLPGSQPGSRRALLLDRTRALPLALPAFGRDGAAACDADAADAFGRSARSAGGGSVGSLGSPSSIGMEALYLSPSPTPRAGGGDGPPSSAAAAAAAASPTAEEAEGGHPPGPTPEDRLEEDATPDPAHLPRLAAPGDVAVSAADEPADEDEDSHVCVPILAVRRQRAGEEERYREDPAVVDLRVLAPPRPDGGGALPAPGRDDEEEEDEEDEDEFGRGGRSVPTQRDLGSELRKKSRWTPSGALASTPSPPARPGDLRLLPTISLRRHLPRSGLADVPYPARVLDRFPAGDRRDAPFPEEELPLFCHPRGGVLERREAGDGAGVLPRAYGFVVKNERGDSIYVSCLTFLEPLTRRRKQQLHQLSVRRRHASVAHRAYCRRASERRRDAFAEHLVRYDDIVTFESKTILLVGRYPFWTEFRRFLLHLHLLSGSSSDVPLERHISHLLLSVPIPRPGGQCVLVPFSTLPEPMALVMPPRKDLPLVDLSYARLFAALDVPTVATVVLGFLCLERKVILISAGQSLLLDCCELLKSLLFPFELCAPYVPHLTKPFMSCLEFPGATFVGIHDDKRTDGLAAMVRGSIPEDSIIVELDTGEINCDGNRYETLKAAYQIIPTESRSLLIKEIETLCQDAGIVPGQEPLIDSIDSSIDYTAVTSVSKNFSTSKHHEPLDDRAVRDSFLRFFCSVLGGYERFLVVPDADFLTSGNDWFNSSGFLSAASVGPSNRRPFLSSLVETQLFQDFIQRRTEASDVHCMLFDECLAEYHSSAMSYGRLSVGDPGPPAQVSYNLLVDQCATEPDLLLEDDENSSFLANRSDVHNKSFGNDNDTATQASSGYAESTISDTPSLPFDIDTTFAINASGDIVTIPSTVGLPTDAKYLYCVDGNPSFPTKFDKRHFLPREPESLDAELSEVAPPPILIRSEREREEAIRLCNATVSRRGPQKQHRCLWQLAKFMGSEFLGAWLMCIPHQISQSGLSVNEKSKILLRALGALRTLRSHRRIVADEAAYRALIVACGRCGTDRRVELMKLYGLMRTDGIFPNAVTLGQYTRAIAEGYSNVSAADGSGTKVGMQVVVSSDRGKKLEGLDLDVLANNSLLEESGMKWRYRGNANPPVGMAQPAARLDGGVLSKGGHDWPHTISPSKTFDTATTQRNTRTKRSWLPVTCSSSFRPTSTTQEGSGTNTVRLLALWSRATTCKACSYIPLDEEIQSGWDVVHSKLEAACAVACPRCAGPIHPLIGYEESTIDELLDSESGDSRQSSLPQTADLDVSGMTQDSVLEELPPQLEPRLKDIDLGSASTMTGEQGYITYLSPHKLRSMLEELVLEYGEHILHRDRLRQINPEVLFNLWWYSSRFSLPLPLATSPLLGNDDELEDDDLSNAFVNGSYDCCAFASWDKSVALHGCRSAAKAIVAAQALPYTSDSVLREKLFDNPSTDIPLLSFFNLQSYAQGDWEIMPEILVALVQACETRDLLPVVECVFKRNQARQEIAQGASRQNGCTPMNASFESTFSAGASTEGSLRPVSADLDCYRTVLYLARYQCTTAFHAFFPTTTKACKGYHFWCAQGTPPLFDKAFREAAESYRKQSKMLLPIPEVSDVALGFRSVFGHVL
ncbi:hypothetical protein ACHAWF_016455, partial [Thalassiosira exigua]